jgi:hypothetical protein
LYLSNLSAFQIALKNTGLRLFERVYEQMSRKHERDCKKRRRQGIMEVERQGRDKGPVPLSQCPPVPGRSV